MRSNGGRLAVALLPTRSQVEPTRERDKMLTVASLLGLSETDIAFNDKVGPAVLDQLTAAGIPVISLHAGLAAASESLASSFYDYDWHLNGSGHRVLASMLLAWLEQGDFLPTR